MKRIHIYNAVQAALDKLA